MYMGMHGDSENIRCSSKAHGLDLDCTWAWLVCVCGLKGQPFI